MIWLHLHAVVRMNKSQIKAIDGNLPDLLERANTGALITYFHAHGAFDFNKYDALRDHLRFPTKQDRAAEFFKTIKDIDGGWNLLEKALIDANQSWLWSQLFDAEQVNLA